MSNAGNFGRQANSTAYIKTFYENNCYSDSTWSNVRYNGSIVLAPTNKNENVYIYKDLIIGGNIIVRSDINLKKNIEDISLNLANQLIEAVPKQYIFKKDIDNKLHYGFIAQELEEIVPNLVQYIDTPIDGKVKSVNYVEMIPLLLLKIKDLQKQIDELKSNK